MIEQIKETAITEKLEYRDKMMLFEDIMCKMPNAKFGDDACPLKHTYADGMYIREITMPANTYVSSKIHKTNHPYFVLRGDVSVITEEGIVRIKAPYWGITKAGTKRTLHVHEETVWITVHATEETDLKKIEAQVIAKDFKELEHKEKPCLGQQ